MKYIVSELIRKKRDGHTLDASELKFLVQGFSDGSIPDYQVSSWLMAVFFRGMNDEETLILTREMKESGDSLQWRHRDPSFKDKKFADKHSTGGVGDKVSIILAPLAATFGLKVPMMSGRGLGFTGGTVDKLESIKGFNLQLSEQEMTDALVKSGVIMMSQSGRLCPADRKLYSLRDVTGTVESLPLITSSIVSKKWAAGVENIVYDVKCGSAAFMPEYAQAKALAQSLVRVSKLAGMNACALMTRMDEPLGAFVGNALEIRECVFILKNKFPADHHEYLASPLTHLTCCLVAEMLVLAGLYTDSKTAYADALKNIRNGSAYSAFEKMLEAQGAIAAWYEQLPDSRVKIPFKAKRDGYIQKIHSRNFGVAGISLKAGRQQSADIIDPTTGFELFKGVGQKVSKGEILCLVHLHDPEQFKQIEERLSATFEIVDHAVSAPPDLILEKIS